MKRYNIKARDLWLTKSRNLENVSMQIEGFFSRIYKALGALSFHDFTIHDPQKICSIPAGDLQNENEMRMLSRQICASTHVGHLRNSIPISNYRITDSGSLDQSILFFIHWFWGKKSPYSLQFCVWNSGLWQNL